MKHLLNILLFVAIIGLKVQAQYEVIPDDKEPGSKILMGIISKQIIVNDTSYKWYAQNQIIYSNPDTAIVNAFARNKAAVNYIIFAGTWCEDSQFIIPKFFILQEKGGIPDDHITLFGLNRQKQTSGNMASAFKIKNTPTIIVMQDGNEIGRVVEYSKTGRWDKELADILNLN